MNTDKRFFSNDIRNQVIIVLTILLIYSQTALFHFAMDDTMLVENNYYVKKGVAGWTELISDNYLSDGNVYLDKGKFTNEAGEYVIGANSKTGQRPLAVLSHCLDVSLFGMNPAFHHATNVLLYIILLLLIYRFFIRVFETSSVEAFFLSMLFLVHPIHVESVANIKGRDDILSVIFGLAAFLSFFKNTRFSSGVSFMFCVLSLLSKESGLIFTIIIPLVHFFKNGAEIKVKNFYQYWHFFLIGGLYVFYRVFYDAGSSEPAMNIYNNAINTVVGKTNQLVFALQIFFHYFELTLWPFPLIWDYTVGHFHYTEDSKNVALLTLLVFAVFAVLFFTKKSFQNFILRAGILIYFIPLIITGNLLIKIPSTFGERFLFLPILGFCLMLFSLLKWAFAKSQSKQIAVLSSLIVVFGLMSFNRVPKWKDSITLCLEDVNHGGSVRTKSALFYHYGKLQNFDSAFILVNELLEADTNHVSSIVGNKSILYDHRGVLFDLNNQIDLAILDFQRAVQMNDTMLEGNVHLAGDLFRKSSKNAGASLKLMNKVLPAYEKRLKPNQTDSSCAVFMSDMSLFYYAIPDKENALKCMLNSIRYGNTKPEMYYEAARLLFEKGDHKKCDELLKVILNKKGKFQADFLKLYQRNLQFVQH